MFRWRTCWSRHRPTFTIGRRGHHAKGGYRESSGHLASPIHPISVDGSHRLPRVLRESTSFLLMDQNVRTEGLFRVNARVTTVDILAEAYDRGQKFVVWKEKDSALTYSHFQEGLGDIMPGEIEQTEGFGVHPAAGLIKRWYAELKEPIFPTSTYAHMMQTYGIGAASLTPSTFYEDLRQDVDHAHLPKTSQMILTSHLLPLLAHVAANKDFNQMTPKNLALCFAPNLIRGPDPLEEVEMSETVSTFLESAISNWKTLSSQLGLDESRFQDSLRTPEAVRDREDPPEEEEEQEEQRIPSGPVQQKQLEVEDPFDGITLVDNDEEEVEDARELGGTPFLPPRPVLPTSSLAGLDRESTVLRKPAPALMKLGSGQSPRGDAGSAAPGGVAVHLEAPGTNAIEGSRQTLANPVSRKPVSTTLSTSS